MRHEKNREKVLICCGISLGRLWTRKKGQKNREIVPSNYRGIKLMFCTMKLCEKIIEKRIKKKTTLGGKQFGFMPKISSTNVIFALR